MSDKDMERQESVDWSKIDSEKINFVLDQSEKCLKAALSNTDSLDRKAFAILAGCLSFSSALITIILTYEFSVSGWLILALMAGGFIGSSIYSLLALETKSIELIGNKPMEMLKFKYSGYDQKHLVSCEAQSNDSKIDKATSVNSIKGNKINRSIKLVQATLVVSLVLLMIKNL